MVDKIIWSPRALATFDVAINYLSEEFADKEVEKFILRVYAKLALLQKQPFIGAVAGKKRNYFKTLVHKKVTLVYHYKPVKKEIELVTFWNNLQDPKSLKY